MSYGYKPQLTLESVVGSSTYVQYAAYDSARRVVQRTLGDNKVVTNYTYYPWDTQDQGGRLEWLRGGISGDLTSLQDLRYAYYWMGNVLTIQDYQVGSPQTQTFSYDNLYRLLSARASDGTQGDYGPKNY